MSVLIVGRANPCLDGEANVPNEPKENSSGVMEVEITSEKRRWKGPALAHCGSVSYNNFSDAGLLLIMPNGFGCLFTVHSHHHSGTLPRLESINLTTAEND